MLTLETTTTRFDPNDFIVRSLQHFYFFFFFLSSFRRRKEGRKEAKYDGKKIDDEISKNLCTTDGQLSPLGEKYITYVRLADPCVRHMHNRVT